MLVKICGLSNSIDALIAARAGADALGFVMGGKVLPAEVEPHAQTVREIIRTLPASVDSYIVTHLTQAEDILALAEYVGSSGIQISEDLPLEEVLKVRQATKRKIIKTIIVHNETSLSRLRQMEPIVDYILLDTQVAGYVGGTGVTSDWNLCTRMIKASRKPVFLAGGLNPQNVAAAIKKANPAGVDVSTGVSEYSVEYLRKDRKNPLAIQSFIQTAKGII